MKQVFISVESGRSKFSRLKYGPFPSEDDAKIFLRKGRWYENVNGEKGLWFVQSGRYEGINARIEILEDPKDCPKYYAI